MAWVKLDDGFYLHPKAIAAGRDGRDIFVTALCWSNQQMTDGVIPAHTLPLIAALAGVADYDTAASRLVEVGLWHNHVEGWEIHQFLESQQSREQREEWLRRDRERKQAARDARKATQVPENVRPESERNLSGIHELSALEKSKSKSKSKSSSKSSSSSSSGPLDNGGPNADPTTDDDRQVINEVIRLLGEADHTRAKADGVRIANPSSHRDTCIRNRWPDATQAHQLHTDHPDWTPSQIAAHIQDPDAARKAERRARIDKALGMN